MNGKWGRGWMLAGGLAIAVGLGGVALAESGQMRVMHGMPGHGMMMSGDPAAMEAHFDKMLAAMVPDATPEQKTRLKAIAQGVHGDLAAVHAQFGKAHQRAHDILLQAVVDRSALEALRVEQMHQMDVQSQHLVAALADAAEVLTPAQRAHLAEQMKSHMQ